MGWSLLPDALRPFKIYCASPSITSQLILFLWQTVEIGTLEHVRVVEALQYFVQNATPWQSEIHIHIAGVQQFHCRLDTFCIKDLYSFQFYLILIYCVNGINYFMIQYVFEGKWKGDIRVSFETETGHCRETICRIDGPCPSDD